MKIAYVNECPAAAELQQFIQSYTLDVNIKENLRAISAQGKDVNHLIAAYDGQQLIAIGFLPHTEAQPDMDDVVIYVLPAYQAREIESNVQKLLMAEWKYSPQPAAF